VINPSCEEVKVEKILLGKVEGTTMSVSKYKIIIPKEEPKPLFAKGQKVYLKEDNNVSQVVDDNTKDWSLWELLPKEETIEEAAEKLYGLADKYSKNRIGFIQGAKWQQERMLEFIKNEDNHTEGELGNSCIDVQSLIHFIEQFKKK
jgi:hypothetical protein